MILKKLRSIIEKYCNIDGSIITMDTKLYDLDLDSLDEAELFLVIEEEFEINFDGAFDITTVKELVDFIRAENG